MFGSLGVPEILFLMILALLIFGPKRLPEIGKTLGKGLSEFRRASSELKRSFEAEVTAIERDAAVESSPAKGGSSRFAGLAAPAETVERGAGTEPAAPAAPAASTKPIDPE